MRVTGRKRHDFVQSQLPLRCLRLHSFTVEVRMSEVLKGEKHRRKACFLDAGKNFLPCMGIFMC